MRTFVVGAAARRLTLRGAALLVACACGCADVARAQQAQQIPAGSVPRALAYHAPRNQLVVSSSGDNAVLVFDLGNLAQPPRTVTSVNTPAGIAVDDELGLAVVANTSSNEISIIDLARLLVVQRITVESTPSGVSINPITHIAVVSNSGSRTLSLVDLRTNRLVGTVADVPVQSDGVQTVAVNGATNFAVAVNTQLNTIVTVDLNTRRVVDIIQVGPRPVAVAINPVTNVAVVCNSSGNSISVVDLATRRVTDVPIGSPQGVAIHVPTNTAVVSSTLSNEVVLVDLANNREIGRITSLNGTAAAAASLSLRQAAVVLPQNNSIAVFGIPVAGQFTVVGGANFQNYVSPGAIVSGFGSGLASGTRSASGLPLPLSLGGTSVRVGTRAAPLFFVSPTQVNFQIPSDVSGRQTVTVSLNDALVVSGEVAVDAASPALFTRNQSGSGAVAALNQDGSPVSADGCVLGARPAPSGSVVQLFGTGPGPLNPQLATGQVAPSSPLSVTRTTPVVLLGGVPVNVEFSGAAPGFVGLWQINIRIPQSPPSGPAVPVVLRIEGRSSLSTANLAVNTSVVPCPR